MINCFCIGMWYLVKYSVASLRSAAVALAPHSRANGKRRARTAEPSRAEHTKKVKHITKNSSRNYFLYIYSGTPRTPLLNRENNIFIHAPSKAIPTRKINENTFVHIWLNKGGSLPLYSHSNQKRNTNKKRHRTNF